MKFKVILLVLLVCLTYSCASKSFKTKYIGDLSVVSQYVRENLEDNNYKFSETPQGQNSVKYKTLDSDPELTINISRSKRRSDNVTVEVIAKSKYPVGSDDPYKSIRDIVDNITVRLAEDEERGRAPTMPTSVTQDTNPPKIYISSHNIRGLEIERKSQTTIRGQITDDSQLSEVLVNNEKVSIDGKGNFTKAISLSKGDNIINITAVDIHNNRAQEQFTIARKQDYSSQVSTSQGGLKTIPNWYSQQYAFVIGIDNYKNPQIPTLQNAV